jgi:tetratricopeptide (TPR) repeat protein
MAVRRGSIAGAAPANVGRSPLAGEMDEFLMEDEPSGGKADDFSFDEPAAHAGFEEREDINEIFYKAMKFFSEGQYDDAIALYEAVLNFKSLKNESERKTFEKAHFEIGRCYYKLRRFKEALEAFSGLIKKFPNSDLLKSGYLYIGMIFEDTKNAEKALGYYQKNASMEPKDQITKEAVNRIAKLKNQGRR